MFDRILVAPVGTPPPAALAMHHEWSDISAAVERTEDTFEQQRELIQRAAEAPWHRALTPESRAIIASAVRHE